MRKAIGTLALGIVLLCPTAWANESNKEKADQLKKLSGAWEFFVEIPGRGRTNLWYDFYRVNFMPEGTPFLSGTTPFIKSLTVLMSKKTMGGYQFSVEQVQEVGENELACTTYIFNPGPPRDWASETFIEGQVKMGNGLKEYNGDNTYTPKCLFDKEETLRGTFVGIKR